MYHTCSQDLTSVVFSGYTGVLSIPSPPPPPPPPPAYCENTLEWKIFASEPINQRETNISRPPCSCTRPYLHFALFVGHCTTTCNQFRGKLLLMSPHPGKPVAQCKGQLRIQCGHLSTSMANQAFTYFWKQFFRCTLETLVWVHCQFMDPLLSPNTCKQVLHPKDSYAGSKIWTPDPWYCLQTPPYLFELRTFGHTNRRSVIKTICCNRKSENKRNLFHPRSLRRKWWLRHFLL